MSICPITYEKLKSDELIYSSKGLHRVSASLKKLNAFAYSAEEQRREAAMRASKISIQGVQPKLSAVIDIKTQSFRIADQKGVYILKPQSPIYLELPENEDLSMRLAKSIGIEVPLHGLIYCTDKSRTYFVKRFDRIQRNKKLALEDFAQLSGATRDTKYDSSMENVAKIIENFCTFPVIEKRKFIKLTIFNFLIGNEDMHLKNFSLITRENRVEMSPAYDLLNSSIANPNFTEEIALTLRGKKRKIKREDLIDYFAISRLGLATKVVDSVLGDIKVKKKEWDKMIDVSFLSKEMQEKYKRLLSDRSSIVFGD